jgi:hypothetical protein
VTLIQRDTPFPHWEFTSPEGDQLRVVPERGGLVCGWRCGGSERLYFDAERFADPAKSVRGGIPVLFPVCGNLPDNRLELPQGRVELAQHGFARDRPWQLQALADGRGIRLELRDDPITRASYPFAFRLVLEVRLEPAALAIRALVRCPSLWACTPMSLWLIWGAPRSRGCPPAASITSRPARRTPLLSWRGCHREWICGWSARTPAPPPQQPLRPLQRGFSPASAVRMVRPLRPPSSCRLSPPSITP